MASHYEQENIIYKFLPNFIIRCDLTEITHHQINLTPLNGNLDEKFALI